MVNAALVSVAFYNYYCTPWARQGKALGFGRAMPVGHSARAISTDRMTTPAGDVHDIASWRDGDVHERPSEGRARDEGSARTARRRTTATMQPRQRHAPQNARSSYRHGVLKMRTRGSHFICRFVNCRVQLYHAKAKSTNILLQFLHSLGRLGFDLSVCGWPQGSK